MIKNNDRKKWFGASDTAIIAGNWDTKSFFEWWLVKTGLIDSNTPETVAMSLGNKYEIPIIKKICEMKNIKIKLGRRPVYNKEYQVRVNYDGIMKDRDVEIKTSKHNHIKVDNAHWKQCQVEMFCNNKKRCDIYYYKLDEIDYMFPLSGGIDEKKIKCFKIEYDEKFIEKIMKPRWKCLKWCYENDITPTNKILEDFINERKNNNE